MFASPMLSEETLALLAGTSVLPYVATALANWANTRILHRNSAKDIES